MRDLALVLRVLAAIAFAVAIYNSPGPVEFPAGTAFIPSSVGFWAALPAGLLLLTVSLILDDFARRQVRPAVVIAFLLVAYALMLYSVVEPTGPPLPTRYPLRQVQRSLVVVAVVSRTPVRGASK